jgi:hypothetical protein
MQGGFTMADYSFVKDGNGSVLRYILVVILAIGVLSGCSKKPVEIDVSDSIQSEIEKDIPAKDYAFYVPEASPPKTMEELQQWALVVCTSDSHIWISAAFDLKIANTTSTVSSDSSSIADCLSRAAKNPNTIILTERSNKLPSDVKLLEIIFK